MFASRSLAFAYLSSPLRKAAVDRSTASAPARRGWPKNLMAWMIGGLDAMGEMPAHFLAGNHLRRDIGLPPIMPDGWPH